MRIEDKFLDKLTFYRIKHTIFDYENTPWRCIKNITGEEKEKDCYFTHSLYETHMNENKELYLSLIHI